MGRTKELVTYNSPHNWRDKSSQSFTTGMRSCPIHQSSSLRRSGLEKFLVYFSSWSTAQTGQCSSTSRERMKSVLFLRVAPPGLVSTAGRTCSLLASTEEVVSGKRSMVEVANNLLCAAKYVHNVRDIAEGGGYCVLHFVGSTHFASRFNTIEQDRPWL